MLVAASGDCSLSIHTHTHTHSYHLSLPFSCRDLLVKYGEGNKRLLFQCTVSIASKSESEEKSMFLLRRILKIEACYDI